MIYACDACRYLFESEKPITQCPDCGKYKVRLATDDEISEYEKRRFEADDWDDGGRLGGQKITGDPR